MESPSGRSRQALVMEPGGRPLEGAPPLAAAARPDRWPERVLAAAGNYLALTKPRVVLLLLITTVPAMIVAEGGWPPTLLVGATLLGGALSAGGANAINCWFDRDIDGVMRRTRERPTVTGAVSPGQAAGFGALLGGVAFILLWLAATPLAASLSLLALLFYVFVYTIWLKRRTDQNIVIGGAAGAFPPVVGWAAVTGEISVTAVALFLIIFLWTPPHFWALSLRLADDYGRANVPMLPVTRGAAVTRRQVAGYSAVLTITTLAVIPFTPLGLLYGVCAGLLGTGFLYGAVRLWQDPARPSIGLYKYSLLYLALLFVAMAADTLVTG